jgi:hypothetical protein
MIESPWVVYTYDMTALIGAFLVVYVMQKTEHDRINKMAPPWLQWVRRMAFVVMAMLLCNSILDAASRVSLMLLVGSGVVSIAINAIALHLRVPPDHWSKTPAKAGFTSTLRQIFVHFRNGLFSK